MSTIIHLTIMVALVILGLWGQHHYHRQIEQKRDQMERLPMSSRQHQRQSIGLDALMLAVWWVVALLAIVAIIGQLMS